MRILILHHRVLKKWESLLSTLKILIYKAIFFTSLDLPWDTKINLSSIIYPLRGKILIGKNVNLRSNKRNYHAGMPFSARLYTDVENALIQIGDNTRINGACIHAKKRIIVGKNCEIASGVNILDSNGHETNSLNRTTGKDNPEDIIIGDNVWIGLNSLVLKGSKIGNNSIIAANSVVKGIYPENSIISYPIAQIVKRI